MSFVARTKDDLHQLLRREGIMHPFRKPQVLIRMPQMADPEARAWESRLESLRQQCGCSAGAFALCGFVFFFMIVSAQNNLLTTGNPPLREFLVVGVVFLSGLILAALAGKLFGLSLASVRYRRTCFDLQERLRQLEASRGASRKQSSDNPPDDAARRVESGSAQTNLFVLSKDGEFVAAARMTAKAPAVFADRSRR